MQVGPGQGLGPIGGGVACCFLFVAGPKKLKGWFCLFKENPRTATFCLILGPKDWKSAKKQRTILLLGLKAQTMKLVRSFWRANFGQYFKLPPSDCLANPKFTDLVRNDLILSPPFGSRSPILYSLRSPSSSSINIAAVGSLAGRISPPSTISSLFLAIIRYATVSMHIQVTRSNTCKTLLFK